MLLAPLKDPSPSVQFRARGSLWPALALLIGIMPHAHAATRTVNNTTDPSSGTAANCAPGNAGTCSLRDALAAAANGDTILFDVGTGQTITLTSHATLTIAHSVTIDGTGTDYLSVDGDHATTVFTIPAGVTASLAHLTIQNGSTATYGGGFHNYGTLQIDDSYVSSNSAAAGGAIFGENATTLVVTNSVFNGNGANAYGGGIWNQGSADVSDSAFVSNTAGTSGGAFYNAVNGVATIRDSTLKLGSAQAGAAIVNVTTLTIIGSMLYDNTATNVGGAIYHGQGTLTIANSTMADNTANVEAGALYSEDALTLTNVTFAGNSSPYGVDIEHKSQFPSYASAHVDNTIFGGGCVLSGGSIIGGHNLDAGTTCALGPANSNADLKLGPVQYDVGPTKSVLPGYGSKAIDFGNDAICAAAPINNLDQRGRPRPVGPHCDTGAVEVTTHLYVKADATGTNNGLSWTDAFVDLNSALAAPKVQEVWIARGTYKPTATSNRALSFNVPPQTAVYGGYAGYGDVRDPALYRTVLSGDIDNNDTGPGGIDSDSSQIVGNNSYHVVTLDGTAAKGPILGTTVIDGLTITGGAATAAAPDDSGGGVLCKGAGASHACSPTLSNLHISGNTAAYVGGGLHADGSNGGAVSPLVSATAFSGNSASNGGAVYDYLTGASHPSFANVTFANNHVTAYGGAVYDYSDGGSPSVSMSNVTFNGNQAGAGGGALAEYSCAATLTSTIANGILWGDSGGEIVHVCSALTFQNSVVQGSGGSAAWNATFGTDGGNNLDADPKLGVLKDNGGSTPTLMPGNGSSAQDHGLASACSDVDQRGMHRPFGLFCDIGAVESTRLAMTVTDYHDYGRYGDQFWYFVTLQNPDPLYGVVDVHVTAAGSPALDAPSSYWTFYPQPCPDPCFLPNNPGPLDTTVTIGPNTTLTWFVFATAGAASTAATATLTAHANGAAAISDVDTLVLYRDGFE